LPGIRGRTTSVRIFFCDSLLLPKASIKGAFLMENIRNLLQNEGFHKFLFFLAIIIFNWPFLTIIGEKGTESVFIYLYLSWGLIILLLFFIAQSHKTETSGYKEVKEGEAADV
jgi:hypothetical protein